jgi:hypothetical protein
VAALPARRRRYYGYMAWAGDYISGGACRCSGCLAAISAAMQLRPPAPKALALSTREPPLQVRTPAAAGALSSGCRARRPLRLPPHRHESRRRRLLPPRRRLDLPPRRHVPRCRWPAAPPHPNHRRSWPSARHPLARPCPGRHQGCPPSPRPAPRPAPGHPHALRPLRDPPRHPHPSASHLQPQCSSQSTAPPAAWVGQGA